MKTMNPVKFLSLEDGPEAADTIAERKRGDVALCGPDCKTSLCRSCDNDEADTTREKGPNALPYAIIPPMTAPPSYDDEREQHFGTTDTGDVSDRPPGFKENNPKDAFGTLKAGLTSYLYQPVLFEMAVGMAAGAFKYGAHNYVCVAPRASVYTDAAVRHIAKFVAGEDLDPEAGEGMTVSHITAAMNSLHVLRAAMIAGQWVDDRPPPAPEGWLEALNAQMIQLAKNNPTPVARYLANGKRGPGRIL